MDPIALFEQKQTETSARFWREAKEKCVELGLSLFEAKLALLTLCGMTPWQALIQLSTDENFDRSLFQSNETISQLRPLAEKFLARQAVKNFKVWARDHAEKLYSLDLQAYDWSFKDAENELRYLLDIAKERIALERRLTPATANSIINAVKELNAMHKFSGNNFNVSNTKAVIFVGEDALPE